MSASAHTRAEAKAMGRSRDEQREFERRAVAEHYEHHPEIFRMVLGKHVAYATGIYMEPDDTLDRAQDRKLAHIRNLLQIRPGDRVFDAGCGWGSVLLYLAEHTEGEFHGITLSAAQREELLRQASERGLADRVRVDLTHIEDVRFEPESYDAFVFSGSIVHMHNREAIHQKVADALKPGGRHFISDCYFPVTARGDRMSDATQYILADTLGYCRLITLSEELAMIEQAGMDVRLAEDLTSSYVKTVAHWIDNVRAHRDRIDALSPGFAHILQTYMAIGRLSFARRTALEYMVLATKGGAGPTDHPDWTIPGRAR